MQVGFFLHSCLMDPASNANSIPPRTSWHCKFIISANNFLQHRWQEQDSCNKIKGDIFQGIDTILIFFPNICQVIQNKRRLLARPQKRLVDEVTHDALLYLAKLLETNKDKTQNFWVSQEPICKTTDGKLPGHCKVTRYSKITKQYIALSFWIFISVRHKSSTCFRDGKYHKGEAECNCTWLFPCCNC